MVARTVSRALSVLSAWNRRAKERIAQDLYAGTDVIDYLGAIAECEDSCSPALPIVAQSLDGFVAATTGNHL